MKSRFKNRGKQWLGQKHAREVVSLLKKYSRAFTILPFIYGKECQNDNG